MAVDRIGDGIALRSKGDIVSHDGTSMYVVQSSSSGQVLQVSSTSPAGIVWVAANTQAIEGYKSISHTSLTSTASSITLNSIPNSYDGIVAIISARTTSAVNAASISINVNSISTGYRYVKHWFYATSTYEVTSQTSSQTKLAIADGAIGGNQSTANFSSLKLYFPNYASTTYSKTFRCTNGTITDANSSSSIGFIGGWIDTTEAISSITMYADSGAFSSGTSISLYGWVNS